MIHPFINTAVKAARNAGDIIMRGYERKDLVKISSKGTKDIVTDIDHAAEREIIDILSTAYPEHSILAEESGHTEGDDYQWIIDPLDGTTNFAHGFPHFSVSIALKHKNRIEHGVIYDPLRNDLFTASRGQGAQKNNQRIRVSQCTQLEKALIGTGFPYRSPEQHDAYYKALSNLSKDALAIRRAGSAALDLAYIASGQMDGFWEFGLAPWDLAAGILLIKEAGGLMCDIHGGEDYLKTGSLIAGTPKIFKQLIRLLKPFF